MTDIREYLREEAGKIGHDLSGRQLSDFQTYLDFLLETNRQMNLTAITDPMEAVQKHFIDCMLLLNACDLPKGASVADVGTGAGFPGMVLKIVRNDLNLVLIDSLQKRLVFLDQLCEKLQLPAKTVHLRAEEAGRKPEYREKFDFVTARAVAPLHVLCEYCLPLLRTGGRFIAMKSLRAQEETEQAEKAIRILSAGSTELKTMSLGEDMTRTFVIIEKKNRTPAQYPRQAGKISKSPLLP